jgi:hypothetical protein
LVLADTATECQRADSETRCSSYPNGTLQLTYETAGTPTYGNLAVGEDELQRLAASAKQADSGG